MTTLLSLEKKAGLSLQKKEIFGEKAQIVLVLDISTSMRSLYSSGVIQKVVERLLAIGLNMDDNREIDVFAFGRHAHEISSANESNINGFVEKVLLQKVSLENSTHYSGVMGKVVKKFGQSPVSEPTPAPVKKGFFSKLFGSKEVSEPVASAPKLQPDYPTFVFFITDGDNFDQPETTRLIQQISNQPIFWQFVGVGNSRFDFLKKLDEMEGRYMDNANFFQLNDISSVSDEVLYDRLLNEYPQWLKEVRNKNMLAN